ncbi:hypothetical protein AnigIFM63309_009829 [Aspergillus niger]|nr:hypothetical protein AnigIFM63309_009829 [Aspergillus niger]
MTISKSDFQRTFSVDPIGPRMDVQLCERKLCQIVEPYFVSTNKQRKCVDAHCNVSIPASTAIRPLIEKVAGQLAEDTKIVTDHRKTWKPIIGLQLFDARNPTRDLRDLPDPELLATAAPSHLGFLPRGEYLLRALRETFDVPDTPFWHAVA